MNKMNNLEIINNEESNSNNIKENKSKSKLIKETIESKGIPILAQEDSQILTAEQYYKTNFPEYKIHKVEPFLFITMGDLTTFSFKKTDNFQPRFSFGPYWFITIMLYFVFYLLTAILYRKIFYKNTSFRIKTFYWLEFSIYIFWFLIFLIQPRIIMNKKKVCKNIVIALNATFITILMIKLIIVIVVESVYHKWIIIVIFWGNA